MARIAAPPGTSASASQPSAGGSSRSSARARTFERLANPPESLLKTQDPELWRGPRVMVPVHVEALHVEPDSSTRWADIGLRFGLGGDVVRPAPFTDRTPRPPGIYLHWALPDGLTRGKSLQEGGTREEELPAVGDSIGPYTIGAQLEVGVEHPRNIAAQPEFPLLPDRWLVVRIARGGDDEAAPRRLRVWAIESDRGLVSDLPDWRPGATVLIRRRSSWGTVLGDGELSWTAVFDSAQDHFAFHDPLEPDGAGEVRGPLSYVVVGWYSEREEDPLWMDAEGKVSAWERRLEELGWSIHGASVSEAAAEWEAFVAQQAAAETGGAGGSVGGEGYASSERSAGAAGSARSADSAGSAGSSAGSGSSSGPAAAGGRSTSVMSRSGVKLGDWTTRPRAVADKELRFAGGVGPVVGGATTGPAVGPLPGPETSDAPTGAIPPGSVQEAPAPPWWPRQILCHGSVIGIPLDGPDPEWLVSPTSIPALRDLEVAVGNGQVEALGALLAAHMYYELSPELELPLLEAFHYGCVNELEQPDGAHRLRDRLHELSFRSHLGGYYLDIVRELDQERSRRRRPPTGGGSIREDLGDFTLAEAHVRRSRTVRRPGPRYYQPVDPVFAIRGPHRSLRHGYDGRFEQDGTLRCRVSGQDIDGIVVEVYGASPPHFDIAGRYSVTLGGEQIHQGWFEHGGVVPEARTLVEETLLLDPSSALALARHAVDFTDPNASPRAVELTAAPLRAEQMAWWVLFAGSNLYDVLSTDQVEAFRQGLASPGGDEESFAADAEAFAQESPFRGGTFPSPLALQPWRRAWVPLLLEWEAAYHPTPGGLNGWRIGERDFELRDATLLDELPEAAAVFQGRSLLTPGAEDGLAGQVERFLAEEDTRDRTGTGTLEEESELRLARLARVLRRMDVLVAPIDHLDGHLLRMADAEPIRAGLLAIRRLRVVDAFGQMLEFAPGRETPDRVPLRVHPSLLASPLGDLIALRPRLHAPARLSFRLLQAEGESEATNTASPVCGYLLPDNLDFAIEVFDAQGQTLGQITHADPAAGEAVKGGRLVWESVPGQPSASRPAIPNQSLARIVERLLAWGVLDQRRLEEFERDRAAGSDRPRPEGVLSALIRSIDATMWTVDPYAHLGEEFITTLVGRPVAVVRAVLRLELDARRAGGYAGLIDRLRRQVFEVRLGSLTKITDGLLGYFLNDDYTRFFPVHSQQDVAGEHTPADGTVRTFTTAHPYVVPDPRVELRVDQRVPVTLLVYATGSVHATTGFLPRKEITLIREHVEQAINRMTPTFKIGPVLVHPGEIRVPVPSEEGFVWNWDYRDSRVTWSEEEVATSTDDAQLYDYGPTATEGWLKLSRWTEDQPESNSG